MIYYEPGTYEIPLKAKDRCGNETIQNRSVTVVQMEVYAVFDTTDNSLVFFRDQAGEYTNGEVIGTKTYYAGIETATTVLWRTSVRRLVEHVEFETNVAPASTAYWFAMSKLTSIVALERLNTMNVTDMSSMFEGAKITSLDLSTFDTSNVTDMSRMFNACSKLENVDLTSFDTSNVTDMSHMFNDTNIETLDLSSFDTSSVTNANAMFQKFGVTTRLKTIYASDNFVFTGAPLTQNVFIDTRLLVGGNGTTWANTRMTGTYARIDRAGSIGYFTEKGV